MCCAWLVLTPKWEGPAWTQKVRHRGQACKGPHRRQVGRPTRFASINLLNTLVCAYCRMLPITTWLLCYGPVLRLLIVEHDCNSASMGKASLPDSASTSS